MVKICRFGIRPFSNSCREKFRVRQKLEYKSDFDLQLDMIEEQAKKDQLDDAQLRKLLGVAKGLQDLLGFDPLRSAACL